MRPDPISNCRSNATFECVSVAVLVANLDPEVRAAIDDVDRILITLTLEQTPWNGRGRPREWRKRSVGSEMPSHPKVTDLPALLAKLCDGGRVYCRWWRSVRDSRCADYDQRSRYRSPPDSREYRAAAAAEPMVRLVGPGDRPDGR